jgi:outer membrane protein assembly factor BamA
LLRSWVQTSTFASGVSGSPALIQSNFGGQGNNFEVVVRVGDRLQHWYRNHDDPTFPWVPTKTFASGVAIFP